VLGGDERLSIIGLLALIVALELQVRFVEEPYLATVHGEPHEAYRRRVGRFVPGLR
jgi:protein-S-isoprenylcysteine O-methyltransferase Ste14